MQIRELYHGTNGDIILQIVRQGLIRPNADGKIYFSEWRFDSVLMHGADTKRRATFAVKLCVTIPDSASIQKAMTPGVADTIVISTAIPLQVCALELYVRASGASSIATIKGAAEIAKCLSVV